MKFEKIANPLTIVAAFCSISEIAAVSVMPKLSEPLQAIFIWFVMGFPFALLIFFFITWNLNAKVLYSPSDFKDENNFILYSTREKLRATAAMVNEAVENGQMQSETADEVKISLSEMERMIDDIAKNASEETGKFAALMSVLVSNPSGLTPKELCEKLGHSMTRINSLLKDGIKQKCISIEHDKDSKTVKYKWTWGN